MPNPSSPTRTTRLMEARSRSDAEKGGYAIGRRLLAIFLRRAIIMTTRITKITPAIIRIVVGLIEHLPDLKYGGH